MENEIIYGRNSVFEALKTNPSRINKIIISKNVNNDKKINEIIDLAKENKILFQSLI